MRHSNGARGVRETYIKAAFKPCTQLGFSHPGLSVTDRPAIKRESISTLLSKGLVPPTDRIILEIQKLCNLGAGFAFV